MTCDVACRMPTEEQVPCFVYFLYDRDGAVLYIGQTTDVDRRVREHRRSSSWGQYIARVEATASPVHRHEARVIERYAIRAQAPPFNVRDHPDWVEGRPLRAHLDYVAARAA